MKTELHNRSVRVATFEKYEFAKEFRIDKTDDGWVEKAYCIPCAKFIAEIESNVQTNEKFRGKVDIKLVRAYVDGVDRVHKHNLINHCKSLAHAFARDKVQSKQDETLLPAFNTFNPSSTLLRLSALLRR